MAPTAISGPNGSPAIALPRRLRAHNTFNAGEGRVGSQTTADLAHRHGNA